MGNQQPTNTHATTQPTDDEIYTAVPITFVPFLFHTSDHPECFDPDCICHAQKIADLTQAVIDGLATPDDATRIMQGKTI